MRFFELGGGFLMGFLCCGFFFYLLLSASLREVKIYFSLEALLPEADEVWVLEHEHTFTYSFAT